MARTAVDGGESDGVCGAMDEVAGAAGSMQMGGGGVYVVVGGGGVRRRD